MTEIVLQEQKETSNYLFQQAKVLSNTEIVPQHLRGKPEHIYAIILTGHEIGISPTNALQSFASINGKLTMSAELMRALILGAGHSLSFPESTRESCTIVGKRKDTGDTATVTYTKDDAQLAGLWGSHTWKKYPRQLLSARATTEIARLLFPDLIKGISYTPEELGSVYSETDDKPTFQVEQPTIEGVIIEPDTSREDERQDPPEEQSTLAVAVKTITQTQMKKAFAIYNKLPDDLQTQAEQARVTLFGEKSRKEYTRDEANQWIEYLESLNAN